MSSQLKIFQRKSSQRRKRAILLIGTLLGTIGACSGSHTPGGPNEPPRGTVLDSTAVTVRATWDQPHPLIAVQTSLVALRDSQTRTHSLLEVAEFDELPQGTVWMVHCLGIGSAGLPIAEGQAEVGPLGPTTQLVEVVLEPLPMAVQGSFPVQWDLELDVGKRLGTLRDTVANPTRAFMDALIAAASSANLGSTHDLERQLTLVWIGTTALAGVENPDANGDGIIDAADLLAHFIPLDSLRTWHDPFAALQLSGLAVINETAEDGRVAGQWLWDTLHYGSNERRHELALVDMKPPVLSSSLIGSVTEHAPMLVCMEIEPESVSLPLGTITAHVLSERIPSIEDAIGCDTMGRCGCDRVETIIGWGNALCGVAVAGLHSELHDALFESLRPLDDAAWDVSTEVMLEDTDYDLSPDVLSGTIIGTLRLANDSVGVGGEITTIGP